MQEDFEFPEYYTRVDIHQHPGGVWSDPIAGFVYERGARSTTPLAGQRHRDLHERLTAAALERCPAPARVLDMGCGFGKSTRPFYEALPQAQVEAIDLSAPCLRLAARDAAQAGARDVRFRQIDARAPTIRPKASTSSPRPCCCTSCRPQWWSGRWPRRTRCCSRAAGWCTSTSCPGPRPSTG